jgi:hypothetical protein
MKDKLPGYGADSEDILPDFQANSYKTKSLLKRLSFGGNLQFNGGNNFLPTTTDLAVQVAYQLNTKSSFGIGTAAKIGIGSWDAIRLTGEGIGLRSFMDWKIKGDFYINGGFELNYLNAVNNLQQLQNQDAWQKSALLGVSRKFKVSTKLKGSVQLLYDFLYQQYQPIRTPVIFRIGYSF